MLRLFGWYSGLNTNEEKTKAIGLGAWKKLKGTYSGLKISPDPHKILGIWFCHNKKRMQDLNVGGKLERLKILMNSWFNRGLTIQGKIMVLKTLGISQLTYPMINLFVPQVTLTQIDKFVFNYIWGGPRKAKVRRNVLIQDYKDGGLKAPDIYTMDTVWKLAWINRLQNSESGIWKNAFLNKLGKVGGLDYLLNSNFDVKKLPIRLSDFWEKVLESYGDVMGTERQPQTKQDVRDQIINNNKNILIAGKSIFMETLIRQEMDEVANWFDIYGYPRTYIWIKRRLPDLPWLMYLQIMAAIPRDWKSLLKTQTRYGMDVASDTKVFNIKSAKISLLNKQLSEPAAVGNWEIDTDWGKTFCLARKITSESKLQVFQFKVLHRIIATNQWLCKKKIIDNPHCSDCTDQVETIEHMLLNCPKSKLLWRELTQMYMVKEGKQISPSVSTIILGIRSGSPKLRCWNYLALLTKFYIYRTRLHNDTMSWPACKAFIKYKLNIELWLATQDNNESKLRQWKNWKDFASKD